MAKKQVSPGVLALRKVVDDVHKDAREAKKRGELVGWSSSKFPCELAAAFDLTTISADTHVSALLMRLASALPVNLTRRPVNISSIRPLESP